MNRVKGKTARIVAGACLVAALVAVPSAQAAVTASHITKPADVTYLVYNHDTPNTFAIAGTSNGTTGGHVDLHCYAGDKTTMIAANVPLKADGSFSVPAAALVNADTYRICKLKAVPAGTAPGLLTPFAGPRLLVGSKENYIVNGGPNDGHVYDFYLYSQQLHGGMDFYSLGGCGIANSYLVDSNDSLSTVPFYCNGWLTEGSPYTQTRSELQIDGANAYPAATAEGIDEAATGLPAVKYSSSFDKKTGDLVIHETENLVKCSNPSWPPTSVSCATFVSTGVVDHRTLSQDHAGLVAWITDVFTSTNGHSHTLNMLWQNNQHFYGNGTSYSATNVQYEFPGQSSYSTHIVGDSVSLPNSPGTILMRMKGAADGDTHSGRGAIVYDRPATAAAFDNSTDSQNDFTLAQTGTVPAHGSARFRFAYVQDFTQASVNSLAQNAATVFKGCTVPNVVGKSLSAAKKAIAGAHCAVGKIAHARSATVVKGHVVTEKPKAKTHVDYGSKVSLVVSTGP